ncbi:MAG: S41 family peptidase [Saprospiraceae bacterium]|nr:S41 family peptidase [Saprospiraceae bacterium]
MGGHLPLSSTEKVNIFLPLLLALALAGGIWLGFELSNNNKNPNLVLGKLDEILQFIDARYLENESKNKLEDTAINAILDELDPHSNYISLDNIEMVNESLSGNFDGIGIEFFILEDTIFIVGVINKGPSDSAGLMIGDKIIMINDSLVAGNGIYNKDVVNKLKGLAGSDVTIKIKRMGEENLIPITITRGQIPMYSVDVAYMLNETTGLIKINRFSSTTYKEFMVALENLVRNHNMQDLIIDLRHNPGGYLDAATKILDQLFTSKQLLVYTEGRSYHRKEYNSTGNSNFDIGKVAILINESSASASEIMAGAIQDNDRGIIIGRRSFGKGLVQEQYKLSDGSALRLTVARYYTPSGRYIQKPYDGTEGDYGQDLKHRYESGELSNQDSIHFTDTTIYKTSSGRIVHGGGGIVPDIFIPIDTNILNPYFLVMNSYVRNFVYRYLDQRRHSIKNEFPDFEKFNKNFNINPLIFKRFIAYLETKNITHNDQLLQNFEKLLKTQLKAYIADQIYSKVGMYKTLFKHDPMVLRAIKELKRGQTSVNPSAMNNK